MNAHVRFFLIFCSIFTFQANAKYNGHLVPGNWMEPWSTVMEEAVSGSSLISHEESQIENLCAGYRRDPLKRKIFWSQLFISLSWRESMHGPENWVEFNGGRNDGLYQINPVLRTAYGCADFVLFDPAQNIRCAVKMAEKLTMRYGSFLKGSKGGMAAYWQPLRGSTTLNRRNRNFILDSVKMACRTGGVAYHSPTTMALALEQVDPSVNTIDLEALGLAPWELERTAPSLQYEY